MKPKSAIVIAIACTLGVGVLTWGQWSNRSFIESEVGGVGLGSLDSAPESSSGQAYDDSISGIGSANREFEAEHREYTELTPDEGYELANAMQRCIGMPESVDQFVLEVSELPESKRPPEKYVNSMIGDIRRCEGVPRDRALQLQVLRQAADAGHPRSIGMYASLLPTLAPAKAPLSQDDVERIREIEKVSFEYLVRGARLGDVTSAGYLALKLMRGESIPTSAVVGASGDDAIILREKDSVEAYAWFYALGLTGLQSSMKQAERIAKDLEQEGLLAQAQARGIELSELYFSNDRSRTDSTGG